MHLLRQPRLALLFAGGALNSIGTWAALIAVWGFAAYRFNAGPEQIALLGLGWAAPPALLGMFSGWPIDRFGARPTMVASNLLGIGTTLAMAFAGSFDVIVGLAVASGVVETFGRPAAMSLPPRLVDDKDLLSANAVMGTAENSAIVFGPLVASLAISLWGLRSAFYVDAGTFAAGTLAVLPLRLKPLPVRSAREAHHSALTELTAGLRVAWRTPNVRRVLAIALAVYFSWGACIVMEPLYVKEVLHRSAATLGYLQTSFGIGMLGMTAIVPRLGERVVSVRTIAASVLASGAAAALYVGTHWLWMALGGIFVWGVLTGFFSAPMQTILQRETPIEQHGRVLSTLNGVDGVGSVLAIPLTGVVIGAIGVSPFGALLGSFLVVTGALGLISARRSEPARAEGAQAEPAQAERPQPQLEPSSSSRAAATAG